MVLVANTRVKIRREDLIAKLKATRTEYETGHQAALVKYEAAQVKAEEKVRAAVQKLLSEDSLLDKVETRYNGLSILIGKMELPSKPVKDNTDIDRMLRVLEASCDETILVAVGDSYARYL